MSNASVTSASSDFRGIQNAFRIASSAAGTPSGLITPNTSGNNRPSRLYAIIGMLTSIYPIYLKLYDVAVAPVVGTTVPKLTIPLTSNTVYNGTALVAAPLVFVIGTENIGVSFTSGIGYALTKLPADNDITAIIAGDVTGLNVLWQ